MEKQITPQQIKARAYEARVSVNRLLKHAGVSNSTLWRWEEGKTDPHPVTVGKIMDALKHFEAARTV